MTGRAIVNYCRVGYFRVGVYRSDFDRLVKRLESLGVVSCDLTRRRLQLISPPDTTTGWYSKSFEDSTIEGSLIPRSSTPILMVAGVYARLDAVLFTADVVKLGDEIFDDASNIHYEVKGVKLFKVGDSFSHRECDLTLLPSHELSYTSASPTVNDARYNTKAYLDDPTLGRIVDSNMQTTGGRNLRWIACYSNPDYPILRVFIDKHMEIIFTIDSPDSKPLMQGDLTPYGYEEHVPVHIVTLDTEVNHLAEAELRRVTETFPTGSQRGLERRGTTVLNYGSTQVFDTEFLIDYRRGTT